MNNDHEQRELDALTEAALAIGQDLLLVQGAGGNISEKKDNGTFYIKASGTRLKEAREKNIFVPLDLERARKEVLVSENITQSILENTMYDIAGLRPSIETAIHALLPHTFVFHVHAVATIAASCSVFDVSIAQLRLWGEQNQVDVLAIPYAKPGVHLAQAIAGLKNVDDFSEDTIIVLGNHGLITAANDAQRALDLIHTTERMLRSQWGVGADIQVKMKDSLSDMVNLHGWEKLASFELPQKNIQTLTSGALTPDSAVFLGNKPFTQNPQDQNSPMLLRKNVLFARPSLGQDALEIALSLLWVAHFFPPQESIQVLSEESVTDLIHWEAEKWRQKLQK